MLQGLPSSAGLAVPPLPVQPSTVTAELLNASLATQTLAADLDSSGGGLLGQALPPHSINLTAVQVHGPLHV